MASGVMMYSWSYILCLQGDERPEDSKDHTEDSQVSYNDDTIYNFFTFLEICLH